jgi:hypothetical protein
MFAVVFASLGGILELATLHWVFQAHHDTAWSATDMLLLDIAIWPQVLAARLGYSSGSLIVLLAMNSFGWALIGLPVGAILRRRSPRLTTAL